MVMVGRFHSLQRSNEDLSKSGVKIDGNCATCSSGVLLRVLSFKIILLINDQYVFDKRMGSRWRTSTQSSRSSLALQRPYTIVAWLVPQAPVNHTGFIDESQGKSYKL
jgi:hypothetical protein